MTPPSDRRSRRRAAGAVAVLATLASAAALAVSALPDLDASLQQWQALPTAQQRLLEARVAAWDALPAAQRSEQRSRYQAWLALDDGERSRLRQAALQFAALPAAEQARLQVVFEHQDAMQQQGWRLGSAVGADWPRLQPLFAFVPPAQRSAVLLALRQTDAAQRDDLAALAQRIPPQSRDGFRREWLKQPAAQRGAWLRLRRDQ